MESEEMETYGAVAVAAASTIVCLITEEETDLLQEAQKRKHRFWMRSWMVDRYDHQQNNTMYKFQQELLAMGDVDEFRATLRMPPDVYAELLESVRPYITKKDTNYRKCIPAEERLSMTMRYLALGDCYRTLRQNYRVGMVTVGRIIRETSVAIYEALHREYLTTPSTTEEWLQVAEDFRVRWNLPNTIGAVDGKHVRIVCPPSSGSVFYNYKKYYSIILMALVNASYEFLFVSIGAEGKASDGGVWRKTSLVKLMSDEENPLNIPEPSRVPGMQGYLPYFNVGDDAFALSPHMMKPIPPMAAFLDVQSRIYNYRISRGRMVVEDAFGILCTRFRLYRREIEMRPKGAEQVVMATVVLHNMLSRKCGSVYISRQSVGHEDEHHVYQEGIWRREEPLDDIEPARARNPSRYAQTMRRRLSNYFLTKEGEVHWQYARYKDRN